MATLPNIGHEKPISLDYANSLGTSPFLLSLPSNVSIDRTLHHRPVRLYRLLSADYRAIAKRASRCLQERRARSDENGSSGGEARKGSMELVRWKLIDYDRGMGGETKEGRPWHKY